MPDTEIAREFLVRQALDWRERAEELRTVGENTHSAQARKILLDLAKNWDDMAGKVEQRVQALDGNGRAPLTA